MTIPESALQWAIKTANDQTHGYSQASRWGTPDYDCSSFVISAYEQAGAKLKSAGATYTGDLRQIALKNGFTDVTSKCDLNTCSGMQKGDILLYHISGTNGHTAMYAGNKQIVHARGQSYGSSKAGDQGTEIAVTAYSRSKWQYVLRYTGSGSAASKTTTASSSAAKTATAASKTTGTSAVKKRYAVSTTLPIIRYGDTGTAVKVWQSIIGVEADGEYGDNTKKATLAFQKSKGLEQDAEVGSLTWAAGLKTLT